MLRAIYPDSCYDCGDETTSGQSADSLHYLIDIGIRSEFREREDQQHDQERDWEDEDLRCFVVSGLCERYGPSLFEKIE